MSTNGATRKNPHTKALSTPRTEHRADQIFIRFQLVKKAAPRCSAMAAACEQRRNPEGETTRRTLTDGASHTDMVRRTPRVDALPKIRKRICAGHAIESVNLRLCNRASARGVHPPVAIKTRLHKNRSRADAFACVVRQPLPIQVVLRRLPA